MGAVTGRRRLNRRAREAAAKARRRAEREAMRSAGLTSGAASPYQQKIARKRGGGAVDPRWMWWIERSS